MTTTSRQGTEQGTDVRQKQLPGARQLANRTRQASSSRVQLLSPPGTGLTVPISPDDIFNVAGGVRPILAYDAGLPPPPWPQTAEVAELQHLEVAALVEHVTTQLLRIRTPGPGQLPVAPRCTHLLTWLSGFDGDTWEQRWLASGTDRAPKSWRTAIAGEGAHITHRKALTGAVFDLIACRVLRPSYAWLLFSKNGHAVRLFTALQAQAGFERLRSLPAYQQALLRHQADAEHCLARVMIRTGKQLDELTGEELLHYADVVRTSGRSRREHLAWELLVDSRILVGEPATLRAAWSAKGNTRQHSVTMLVDRYGIPPSGVRDLLVDYLNELKPGLDYSSLVGLAYRLVRLFWCTVLEINPDQRDLRLSPETVTGWRERLAVTADGRTRREVHSTLFAIRALYRDLAEWATDDPARWGPWVAPCPVQRAQSVAAAKDKRRRKATMQARTRALTPLLPALLSAADERRDWTRRLLDTTRSVADGEEFEVDSTSYTRAVWSGRYDISRPSQTWAHVVSSPPGTRPLPLERGRVNISRLEEDAFWSWACIQTLRLTGMRIEELLELTQLSLRHYTPHTTSTLVPLLHIVPSKNDHERLIPMSPELVTVLLEVQRRTRQSDGSIPLSVRYDSHERLHGEPLPHLFARRLGTRHEVLSDGYVRALIRQAATWGDLQDRGQPVRFTPHDFRRLFSTEAVNAGLPLHIAAALLGHLSLDTTRGYTAVFPETVIEAHHALIERRRALRPVAELRSATGEEWTEFEQHFLLRKVALGDCYRPYGTPCVHEHACVRCRFLRVDPAQLGRIDEMTTNAEARLVEAREQTWLGEVAALEETLVHLRRRREETHAQRDTQLGIR